MDNLNCKSLVSDYSLVYQFLGTFATLGIFFLVLALSNQSLKFPLVGEELGGYNKRRRYYLDNAVELYKQGYKKFKNSIWRITSSDGDVVILPLKYTEELRKIADDIVNNAKALDKLTEAKFTGLKADNPLMIHIIKADLTHNLPKVNQLLTLEVARTVPEELGPCTEWTEVNINQKLLRIVAIVSGHIFIGPELCRSPEYLHASIRFTVDLFTAAARLKRWPRLLRGLVKYFVSELDDVQEHRRAAHEFLKPVLRQRRERAKQGEEMSSDLLQWIIYKADKYDVKTDEEIAEIQLNLSMAAIHTTTMTATHMYVQCSRSPINSNLTDLFTNLSVITSVYDIVGHCPEVIPEIREEIRSVLAANDNIMTTQALFQMKLLDSVMRESQRCNPATPVRLVREVLKTFKFSDGTEIPAGTTIGLPHLSTVQDPEHYPDPLTYNPHRFAKIRSGEAEDPLNYPSREQYQFISVTKENMGFGFGRHACPGRFFAANEIKLICARLLMDYDIKLPDGVKARYPNIVRGNAITPDSTKTIMVKRAAA
ncbi:hypothetical protein AAE478_009011 [Parahypoxylon ruwenzoriense]